jgi:oligopeptide/dipeptide ABC transporter ATP-binding protein
VSTDLAAAPAPVLETRDLCKYYPVGSSAFHRSKRVVRAVDGVDIRIESGETLGLVGESGSGKSTLARVVLRLIDASSGAVLIDGEDITAARGKSLRAARDSMQMVFQDPYSSLDPMATVGDSVAEPLQARRHTSRADIAKRVNELFDLVGLSSFHVSRYPSELSGGQLQRAAIARALSVSPDLLLLDEPVSALDVSTQAQVINLLLDLQERFSLACLFISHDLSIVRQVSERIAVMYLGRVVETGPVDDVYRAPKHPYTALLLESIPQPEPGQRSLVGRVTVEGDAPSPTELPSGCRFRSRCPHAMPVCGEVDPPYYAIGDGSLVACHLHTTGPTLAGRSVLQIDGSPTSRPASPPTGDAATPNSQPSNRH